MHALMMPVLIISALFTKEFTFDLTENSTSAAVEIEVESFLLYKNHSKYALVLVSCHISNVG